MWDIGETKLSRYIAYFGIGIQLPAKNVLLVKKENMQRCYQLIWK